MGQPPFVVYAEAFRRRIHVAYHCQDLAFWFDNIDLAAQATGGTEDAHLLARQMSGCARGLRTDR
jgi:carboxylesterase type B